MEKRKEKVSHEGCGARAFLPGQEEQAQKEYLSQNVERLKVRAAGRDWLLERTGDMESLWAEMDQEAFGEDERLPYWAEVWPASLLVCEKLQQEQHRIQGRICLDVGCGLGISALVGSRLGARVVAFDYEPRAVRFAHANARLNNVPSPLWTIMDWRFPALARQAFDFIWGGDVLYEKRFFEPLEALFEHCLTPRGEIWLGEPERTVSRPVWDRLRHRGWQCDIVLREKVALGGQNQTVRLWRVRRGATADGLAVSSGATGTRP
ncbi:Predicted nicotinamide N-methyase [Paucidesulfovibrio gracilis DSM 16080]|uniref:Predicted nicotinamide N-methyase n=1 Tax=Paucidesulfovibrio gracilis DSM 16080 TaxID=1121449 RepID=A0A1T4WD06_9BACT|nr:50S ribosomal protein L11 methyltransferase [Paucidesulfovibrio gracilis]SKA75196.1 Predicted nicotinamide N-methyase [Paucidesulfovibrio gracilis DSM 16080]